MYISWIIPQLWALYVTKNPQTLLCTYEVLMIYFHKYIIFCSSFLQKNLLINSLETSESQMIAAGLHYSVVLYKDAVWACCTPLIVLCFSTGTIRLLHSCFSCRETVTGSKWVLTDSTNLSDNTFFKIISIFLIFNELKHAYNMDDIVLSSEMETDLVYQLLIKWTPSVKRQCNNWLQYETYCAQLEVFVQSSPWSLS